MASSEDRVTTQNLSPSKPGSDERLHTITHATAMTLDLKALPTATIEIEQEILELKKQQEQQEQMLFHAFQEKHKQLLLQHKLQMDHKIQYAVHSHGAFQELHATAAVEEHHHHHHHQQQHQQQQRQHQRQQHQQQQERDHLQRERERERRERCEGGSLKRKEDCSANASPEVKQILSCFLMARKAAATGGGNTASNGTTSTTSPYRNRGVVKSSSGESLPAGTIVNSAHPYKIPQLPPSTLLKYESDFPLRKTDCSGTSESGPTSPSSAAGLPVGVIVASRGSPTSAPIQEENEEPSNAYHAAQRNSICDLALFSSPSMPNISLGRPHLSSSTHPNITNYAMHSALRQHVGAAAGGGVSAAATTMGITGNPPTYYNPMAYGRASALQPTPLTHSMSATSVSSSSQASLLGGDITPPQAHAASSIGPTSPLMQMQQPGIVGGAPTSGVVALYAAAAAAAAAASGQQLVQQHAAPITDAQVAHAHLNKQGHRPIGRTQSAPLPLGHPMLTGQGQLSISQTHYENSDAERQAYEQRVLLTQKIRQTVLTRSATLREPQLKEEEDGDDDDSNTEVIDLTDKKKPPRTVPTHAILKSRSATNATSIMYMPGTSTQAIGAAGAMPCPFNNLSTRSKQLRDHEYLQQQRELLYMQALQADAADVSKGLVRPLSRTLSSPLVPLGPHGLNQIADTGQQSSYHQQLNHQHQQSPVSTSSSADHIPPVNLSLAHKRPHMATDYAQNSVSVTATPPIVGIKHQQHFQPSETPSVVSMSHDITPSSSSSSVHSHRPITTGLAYDNTMLKHACLCGNNAVHPEHSGRLQSVWARLVETDLIKRCDRLRSRKAYQEELQTVHTEAHTLLFGSSQCQLNRQKLIGGIGSGNVGVSGASVAGALSPSFIALPCGGIGVDQDTTWNEQHTAAAARMAAGCVIDLAIKTAKGDLKNGFAIVRPPGHHAEPGLAMGFCFFNSIAIAAKLLPKHVPEMRRILIVDWDVHHGNGTQRVFYDNPNVLYLSIHRHDDGKFFPGTGGPTECGTGAGVGFNVNISWSGMLNPPLGDAEYIAAFRTIVMPIAKCFNPNIILVSAGFDAAAGHPPPLGGYYVSPACFGFMTRELMLLAGGKVVLALEGGYDLTAICDSAQECVRALLGDQAAAMSKAELKRPPCQNAIDTLQKTIAIQAQHWPCVRRLAHTVGMSAFDALQIEHDESETVTAMAGLSMHRTHSREDSEEQPMDQDETK